jgi:hypothetical protein
MNELDPAVMLCRVPEERIQAEVSLSLHGTKVILSVRYPGYAVSLLAPRSLLIPPIFYSLPAVYELPNLVLTGV